MATDLSDAAQRRLSKKGRRKKRYKGKYAGPDKYKGIIPPHLRHKYKGKYFGREGLKGGNPEADVNPVETPGKPKPINGGKGKYGRVGVEPVGKPQPIGNGGKYGPIKTGPVGKPSPVPGKVVVQPIGKPSPMASKLRTLPVENSKKLASLNKAKYGRMGAHPVGKPVVAPMYPTKKPLPKNPNMFAQPVKIPKVGRI